MSMERDENYVPRIRSDYKLPPRGQAQPIDYEEIFEEMPLFTLGRMVLMQLLGMQSYLLRNSMGLPSYPPGTNVWPIAFFFCCILLFLNSNKHFNPSSPLFKPHERRRIIASNIGLSIMIYLLNLFLNKCGFRALIRLYAVPYLVGHSSNSATLLF